MHHEDFQMSDSDLDECSAIGVCTLPVTSSSYESSPNMWVRRSYNGQLYHGTSAGYDCVGKVHPGDVVGVEVDMAKGELRFFKNGEDEGVCFRDLAGEVFPIVCTYRSGIEVALLRCTMSESRPQEAALSQRSMELVDVGGVGTVIDDGCGFVHREKDADGSFLTAVSERSFMPDARRWNVEMKSIKDQTGVVAGLVAKPRGQRVTRVPAAEEIWGGGGSDFVGGDEGRLEIGVSGDGAVWINGQKAEYAEGLRSPGWKTGDVVNFRLDCFEKRLEVGLNGDDMLAVSAEGWLDKVVKRGYQVHPAVSIKNCNDHVLLEPAGIGGTTVEIYWLLDLEKSLCHVGGKFASTMVSGPSLSIEEMEHESWLRSPMIIGGLESNEEVSENWMVDVAEETGNGMSVLLGEAERSKERTGTLLGDVIEFTTGEQVRTWIDDDVDMSEVRMCEDLLECVVKRRGVNVLDRSSFCNLVAQNEPVVKYYGLLLSAPPSIVAAVYPPQA